MENKAYKFRIYPNKEQLVYFDDCFRTRNFIYNYFLRDQIDLYDELDMLGFPNKKDKFSIITENKLWFSVKSKQYSPRLTKLSKTDDFSFLRVIDSTAKTYVMRGLEKAFKNIKNGGGFPNFKNKKSNKSYTGGLQYSKEKVLSLSITPTNNKKRFLITLPKNQKNKIEMVIGSGMDFFIDNWNNKTAIKFNSYTISKKGEQYFVSFQVEERNGTIKLNQRPIKKDTSLGVDFGVNRPITTTNTDDFDNKLFSKQIDLLKTNKKELHRLSSILNRKRDFHKKNKSDINFWETTSYKRVKKKITKLHTKISNIRENIQHHITNELVYMNNVDTFILEDLKIKDMTKRTKKGESNNKSNLNRVMLDTGLYSIKTKLQYKADKLGKNVVTVDPKYTSQTCSACGEVNKNSRKTQSQYVCIHCGFEINADLNAAINIKEKYYNLLAQ